MKRNLLSVAKPRQGQGSCRVPAPASAEDRRSERGLLKNAPNGFRSQKVKDIGERKTVLLAQRDVQAVLGRRGLQFKVEGTAKPLAECQSPGSVDSSTKGRVDDELHAARLVKKSLGYDCILGWNRTQSRPAGQNVFDGLLGSLLLQSALILHPGNRQLHFCCR